MPTGSGGVAQDDSLNIAVANLYTLAVQGAAAAQFDLALRCHDGEGVAKDPLEAAKWYRKAADQGDTEAQSRLVSILDRGVAGPEGTGEVATWYRTTTLARASTRTRVILFGIVLMTLMSLFPPWAARFGLKDMRMERRLGNAYLFKPPQIRDRKGQALPG
jgi:TPR repeat protein